MKQFQFEQFRLTRMVNQAMVFIARRFLIFAALPFGVITRYYTSLCLAKNKNQRTLNPIQPRFLGLLQLFCDFGKNMFKILLSLDKKQSSPHTRHLFLASHTSKIKFYPS